MANFKFLETEYQLKKLKPEKLAELKYDKLPERTKTGEAGYEDK